MMQYISAVRSLVLKGCILQAPTVQLLSRLFLLNLASAFYLLDAPSLRVRRTTLRPDVEYACIDVVRLTR